MPLEDYKTDIYTCLRCGQCRIAKRLAKFEPITETCPPGVKFGFESYWPAGKMQIAWGLLEGKVEWSDRLLHRVYTCTTCGACEELCYYATGKRPLHVIEELRRELVSKGIGPVQALRKAQRSIEEYHNPYKMSHGKRFRWLTERVPAKGKVMYYVGCTPSYLRKETAISTVTVLKSAGVEFGILPDEWCCGYPTIHAGYVEQAKEIAEHIVEGFKEAGAERVVFSCPGCYDLFRQCYPELLGGSLPFEVLHTSEYFAKLINEGTLKLVKEVDETVTYHDPCKLGRISEVYNAPREILRRIPGVKLVEMERNRECAWCCGGGGNVPFAYLDFAYWTAQDRIREAEATGAALLASACPGCKNTFMYAGKALKNKPKIEFIDLNELLAMAL